MPSFTFENLRPAPGDTQVRDDSSISGTFVTSDQLFSLTMSLNGERVLTTLDFTNIAWSRPNYRGRISYIHPRIYFTVEHRRRFAPDSVNTVEVVVSYTLGDAIVSSPVTYSFTCEPRLSPVPQALSSLGVLDGPLPQPGLNTLRVMLLDALVARVGAPPAEVLLYDRVKRCSLASALPSRPGYDDARLALVAEDRGSVMSADAQIKQLGPFWEASLVEAKRLGVPDPLIALLDQTMKAPYPQERVGAAAALLLLSKDRL